MRIPILSLLATALLSSPATAAEPRRPPIFAGMPNIVFEYYEVSGRNAREIMASLRAKAMRRPDGQTAMGLTVWRYSFHWGDRIDNKGCRIADARTDISITVTLPRYADPDALAYADRAWWYRYQDSIERHEAGHARIAFEHANDFTSAATGKSCDDARAIGTSVMKRVVDVQNDYDRVTKHGQDQGAVD